MNDYLAHVAEDGRRETVAQHLQGTAQLAERFAAAFDAAEQGRLVGLAHDIGKYSEEFQRRLAGDPSHVDHSTAGAFECARQNQVFATFAVMGHHGGLPDGGARSDPADQSTFWARLKRAQTKRVPSYSAWPGALPPAQLPPYMNNNRDQLEMTFFGRMLYSALVDADFLATEAFMKNASRAESACSMAQLEEMLRKYVAGWFPAKTPLNAQRCAILQHCFEEGETASPGLFSMTVPTGGGKTVSSLAFALAHARAHGLRRVIYVVPYTSIIEQTAKTFRDILGADHVLEHHSGVLYDIENEADAHTIRLAQATENWDMPVIVTTAVQFFESLYANRSSRCRKLHNIAGSVIIFDEAQMLPVPYLRPCVDAIGQLVQHYHVSAVLCTATQPALGRVFKTFYRDMQAKELCPAGLYDPAAFRRVTFRRAGALTWEELSGQLSEREQVLCVVNTRAGAQQVYQRLPREGTFHLSTLMYPAHRQRTLDVIRARLADASRPCCRVVSTSLIEAGVDVDFPAVYREEAGLDSVLQAAGRCNREGKRPAGESQVTVFKGEGHTPALFAIPIAAGQKAMERYEEISSPEAIHCYFRELLDLKGQDAQDKEGILPLIQTTSFPYKTVAERFHLIDSPTRTIYIPLEEGAELVRRMMEGEGGRALLRKLERYGVSVYQQHFERLLNAGAITVLENGNAVLDDLTLYSEETGLSLQADSGQALFW